MNGAFSPRVKRAIVDRQDGACAICSTVLIETVGYSPLRPHEFHHRLPRRSGGRHGDMAHVVGSAANGLLLCSPCHVGLESRRTHSLSRGWIIPDSPGVDPRAVDVWHLGSWCRLTDDGNTRNVTGGAA